jgi:hypothetical protein
MLVAVVAVLVAPIALGESLWVRDVMRYAYPTKGYVRERLLGGELALWNPLLGLGRAYFGLIHPGVIYPLNLVTLLPPPLGLDLFYALHLLIAALGVRAWLRALDLDGLAAWYGGALMALSGYLVSMLAGSGSYVVSVAWVPWALWAALRPSPQRAVAALALTLALCVLGGDPQAAWFAGALVFVQALALPARRRALGVLLGGALLASLVALWQLLPAVEIAAAGRSGGMALAEASHYSLPPARLVELAWPGALGPPYFEHWFGHSLYYEEGQRVSSGAWAHGLYLGLLTPWLAVAALVGKRRPVDFALGLCGLVALLLAFGRHTPLFAVFFRALPPARWFRYPEKYFFVATLCILALAARGLGVVISAPRRAAALALLPLAGYALAAWAALSDGPSLALRLAGDLGEVPPAEAGRVLAVRSMVALAIAFAAWLLLILGPRLGERRLGYAIVALTTVELLFASRALLAWAPSDAYRFEPPPVADLERRAGQELAPTRLYRSMLFDLGADGPPAEMERATLLPNCGTELGIGQLDAYDTFRPEVEQALWHALAAQPMRLLRVTGTRFALLDDRHLAGPPPGLSVVARYPRIGLTLVEVEEIAPRVYLATDARAAADSVQAEELLAAADFVPGHSAVVEGSEPRASEGTCQLTRYAAESIEFECDAARPAYAVLADAYFPGWQATVNGAPAAILRANVAMRAVAVGTGHSRVSMRYRPSGFRLGLLGSIVGLLFAAWLLVRRKSTDAQRGGVTS